ncbi:alanine--tRNA ligase [Gammaproteobacteria bacterium]|nr:alanine--tRNA ligase [Gammaproteobacteria bacterium]
MKSAEIRQKFLDFFASRGHEIVTSSSLVPTNDSTLLFTNAGMVQFKEAFLGEERSYSRATSSQRCVRAGGKHNDLENVGYTARHHTFFEMLGNFSFGDYFKREAIQFAWEFLTEELGLSPEKLWVTVFESDDEAASIWIDEMKIDPGRFSRLGERDNFWSMGDTGPCGPCSEIFYDHGAEVQGGPPGSPDEDGDRYIEIWNLVFMQFEREADGSMIPLPKPSVDTGAGLERLAAVLQKVHSNYEIDLFQFLIKDISLLTGVSNSSDSSLNVIADHIRSCAFLILDGVLPSNEGRGYVLRRIIRRAVRHGYQLGVKDAFFYKLTSSLAKVMGSAYPGLQDKQGHIEKILHEEEEQFARTLENGMAILEKEIENMKGGTLSGKTVFQLYDTYGFPVDLTADIAREKNLELDMAGFTAAMDVQKKSARAASNFGAVDKLDISPSLTTMFTGYKDLINNGKIVAAFSNEGERLETIPQNVEILLLLDKSPFYGESGGQVGDQGNLYNDNAKVLILDTQKQGDTHIHRGILKEGSLEVGDEIYAEVKEKERQAITLNHSATHLLHSALRNILGSHVSQKGSLVEIDRLRFDFSHPSQVTASELDLIEKQVNREILRNSLVSKEVMPLEEAKKKGAVALFGEKYGEDVRVVSMGSKYSVEFCGGCHVNRTGDIGIFKLTSESGISSGVRRIEATTGYGALAVVKREGAALREIGEIIKSSQSDLVNKVLHLSDSNRSLEKEVEQLKAKLAHTASDDLSATAIDLRGIKLLVANVEGFNQKSLRDAVDRLKNKLPSSVVVLGTVSDGKVNLVAGVSKDLTEKIKAGELVNMVAQQVGGKGGGRADMAMAGGSDPTSLQSALNSVQVWVERKI